MCLKLVLTLNTVPTDDSLESVNNFRPKFSMTTSHLNDFELDAALTWKCEGIG